IGRHAVELIKRSQVGPVRAPQDERVAPALPKLSPRVSAHLVDEQLRAELYVYSNRGRRCDAGRALVKATTAEGRRDPVTAFGRLYEECPDPLLGYLPQHFLE